MTRTTGRLEDAYDILAQTPEYILCRSREANPVHTYAVQRLDEEGHAFDIRVKSSREAAEREFCRCCFGWFQ